jgi:NodT family efflux transporter outer membrane factor (OMF) lipoprotein
VIGRALTLPTRLRMATCLATCVALGACAVNPPLPKLPNATPVTWRNAPTDAAKLGPAPNLDSWWLAFDDPQLNALIERALAQNLTLQQAQMRLRGARAMQHRSGTQFKPQLSFHTFSEPDPAATTSYYEIGFDALWELGFFGRGLAHARVAQAGVDSAQTEVEAARVTLIAEVTRDYIELRAAQTRATLLERIAELRDARAKLGQVQLRLQQISREQAGRLDAAAAQAQADAAEPAQAAIAAQQALAVLLAEVEPDAALLATGPQPAAPDAGFAQTPADLLRTRPEIRQAEWNVLRAAGELGIARADLWPKLSLGGTLISSTRVVGDLDHPNKAIPSFGPLIDMPLFDWGARRDAVHARDAALKGAVLAYRQAVLEGVAETETALAQWQRQRADLSAASAVLASSARSAQAAHTLQRIGLADAADSAAADIAQAQAQLARAQAERGAALAYIAVYKSFGGNLPPARRAR